MLKRSCFRKTFGSKRINSCSTYSVIYDFYLNKNNIDFISRKKANELMICSWTKARSQRLLKQISFIKEDFIKKIFLSSRKFSMKKDFSFIKEVSQKQRFFLHQGRFSQAYIFLSSKTFSKSNNFFFIKEVFHKQRFFCAHKRFLE